MEFVFASRRARFRQSCRCLLLAFVFQFTTRADQVVYDDALENGWVSYGWATLNFINTSPVHGGADSISVSSTNWQALYLHHTALTGSQFTNLVFWINGGGSGGQVVQVQATSNGVPQTAVVLAPLSANAWQQETISLASLGVAAITSFDGFWLQVQNSGLAPTFYVDDISLTTNAITASGTNASVAIFVNVASNRVPISPLIYGVAFATNATLLADLNAPLHRYGGNATTRYNWQLNATSHAADWYFESIADANTAGGDGDDFIQESKSGGAQPMLTIPIIGWVAKLGANRASLASYSTNKYGVQTGADPWWPAAGNGVSPNGVNITTNDPTDANLAVTTNFQAGWVQHLTNTWGSATNGGLRYYIMDNEWSLWHSTHRDVHPVGATMSEVFTDFCNYATMVKSIDANALVAGPEEWSWPGYLYSGYDQQWSGANTNYNPADYPDRQAHGGQDFSPWFLSQVQQRSQAAGKRLIDVFTLHCYPQEGSVGSDAVDATTELLRNQSTRQLWDTNYVDPSWINSVIALIPRMKNWVATNYPGTKIGVTEYDWGAEGYISGATAQADLLGIFGWQGLDLATRWTCPGSNSPVYNAFKMYRNYDGNKSAFGGTSVSAAVPNPDNLSAFAAIRTNDSALTVMVVNKTLTGLTPLALNVTNFANSGTAQAWQLTASNFITRLADIAYASGTVSNLLPAQSITLFVLPTAKNLRLRIGTNAPPSQMELWLDGQGGQSYLLQSSTNLSTWSPISTNIFATNSFRFAVGTTNANKMFYRGVLNPP
jgi:hypothetical protein